MTSPIATLITVAILIAAALLIIASRRSRGPHDGARALPPSAESVRILGQMKAMAAPTLMMRTSESPGFSKLGGEPDLPPGIEWPVGPLGPMGFLLQIDLRAAREAGGPDWLPAEGSLWAFLDDRWGDPDQVRVLYGPPGARTPTPPPIGVRRARRYRERFVDFSAHQSCPSLDWMGADVRRIEVSDEERDRLAELFGDLGDAPHHRIGGYPEEIQEINMPVAAECAVQGLDYATLAEPPPEDLREAAGHWRLLFQIDYDSDLKMKWGDGGHIYVLIREADAWSGDVSRTVTLSDTY